MEKIINYENLRNFAYCNDHLIKGEVKGIVLEFCGFNTVTFHSSDNASGREYASKGIIYVIPYYNPWCFMNKTAVKYTDEIVEVLVTKYNLGKNAKIVSTGFSMGGLGALVYSVYGAITPCACIANSPVCDLVYHYENRPGVARALYGSFYEYDCDWYSALRSSSPLHLIDKMPNIPYTIFHCESDTTLNIDAHSTRLVSAMQGLNVNYIKVPFREHCDLSGEAKVEYEKAILKAFEE